MEPRLRLRKFRLDTAQQRFPVTFVSHFYECIKVSFYNAVISLFSLKSTENEKCGYDIKGKGVP